jgi:hypothetical protein
MMWKYIFNPFEKFSEKKLLIFGVLATFAGSFIGHFFGITFTALFDVHLGSNLTFVQVFLENLINIAICFVLIYILAKSINRKTRAVDILNTSMLYRLPLYFLACFTNNKIIREMGEKITEEAKNGHFQPNIPELLFLSIFGVFSIGLLIWSIVILVNGFKTAANVKKWQHFLLFTIALIIGEFFISQLFVYKIVNILK